jgi:dihydroxyacetone kinase
MEPQRAQKKKREETEVQSLRSKVLERRSPPSFGGRAGVSATGGGSGHLPLFLGYVGKGMLDGCSVGGVFQSPSAEQMMNVTNH